MGPGRRVLHADQRPSPPHNGRGPRQIQDDAPPQPTIPQRPSPRKTSADPSVPTSPVRHHKSPECYHPSSVFSAIPPPQRGIGFGPLGRVECGSTAAWPEPPRFFPIVPLSRCVTTASSAVIGKSKRGAPARTPAANTVHHVGLNAKGAGPKLEDMRFVAIGDFPEHQRLNAVGAHGFPRTITP